MSKLSDDIIIVDRVSKRYGATRALSNITLRLGRGLHLILGPNGSGKSTLLSIISGVERPDLGSVNVLGFDPWRDGRSLLNRVVSLLDRTSVYPWTSGVEIAAVAASERGVLWREVLELADYFGVSSYWAKPYMSYSSGMRRKLLLLLAFIGDPEVVIVDEPFQALDKEVSDRVVGVLLERVSRGATVLVATHIFDRRLLEASATITMMEQGRVVVHGRPEQLRVAGENLVEIALKCVKTS